MSHPRFSKTGSISPHIMSLTHKVTAVVPFMPCSNISSTMSYYQDVLGFSGDNWTFGDPASSAAVSKDNTWIFFTLDPELAAKMSGFRLYIEVVNVSGLFEDHKEVKANIIESLAEKPWGSFEYTVEDIHGYHLHFREAPI